MKILNIFILVAISSLPLMAAADSSTNVKVLIGEVQMTYTDSDGDAHTKTICTDSDCGIGDGAQPLDDVIRSGDSSGKMVPIVGGETGREILGVLLSRSSNEGLSAKDRLIADLLQQILINRWFEISQA